jgi:plastocyanin
VQEDGSPKAGASVTWSTTVAAGAVSPTSAQTDAQGLAATRWTLGQTAGSQTATATLASASGSPVTFNATAAPAAPTAFTKTAGDNQTATVNTTFAAALSVKVADQFGNGIAGVTVDWAVQSGGVTLVAGATSITNAVGIATKDVNAGGTPGVAAVRATTAAVAGNLDFALTITLAPVRVSAGNFFFRSVKNSTQNPAVDTAQVGQQVVWSSLNATAHSVQSTDVPTAFQTTLSFSGAQTRSLTFSAVGTYQYDCGIHGPVMSGRIVVIP